jgi:hypothetical protein
MRSGGGPVKVARGLVGGQVLHENAVFEPHLTAE